MHVGVMIENDLDASPLSGLQYHGPHLITVIKLIKLEGATKLIS